MCYNASKKLQVEYPATFSGAILLRERITLCNNIWNWYSPRCFRDKNGKQDPRRLYTYLMVKLHN
jgi:hypothetical protein